MNTLKLILLLSTLASIFSVYNFNIHLEESEELCLDEYFSDKTLVIYEVITDKQNIHVSIYDPSDAVVTSEVFYLIF